MRQYIGLFFFFFTHTAATDIYTLSLHDALPISVGPVRFTHHGGVAMAPKRMPPASFRRRLPATPRAIRPRLPGLDRKSTRLNSSHMSISYAVFCLKKKKISKQQQVSSSLNHRLT